MEARYETVVVVGLGYVGLPMAMAAVTAGLQVVGLEVSSTRIQMLRRRRSYVEDVGDNALATALERGQLRIVDALDEPFDVALITVSSTDQSSGPDTSQIAAAASSIADGVLPGSLVSLESTSYPGTTKEVIVPILAAVTGLQAGQDYDVAYSPERIDPGNTQWTLRNTPKIVAGVSAQSLAAGVAFYSLLVDRVVPVNSTEVAEFVKLIENSYRLVNISFVNELTMYARAVGLNLREALEAASTKPFGFAHFNPGPGAGGHCLPKDTRLLAWHARQAAAMRLTLGEAALQVNEEMPAFVVDRLVQLLTQDQGAASMQGAAVLIAGMSYKPNTSDGRGTRSVEVVRLLGALGAIVTVYDPIYRGDLDVAVNSTLTEVDMTQMSAAVIMTNHDALDYEAILRCPMVLDTRGCLSGDRVYQL